MYEWICKKIDETKYMSFLVKGDELLKKIFKKSGIRLAIVLKKKLIANQSTIKIK